MVVSTAEVSSRGPVVWSALVRNWPSIAQLVLATTIVYLYHIDAPLLFRVMILATIGFPVSVALPRPYRLPFFVGLSLAGCFVTLGIRDGACLIGLGLTLIGICRLHVPLTYRVLGLLAAASLLAVARSQKVDSLWSPAVWPLLGSIFMFRMILYVRAIASKKAGNGLQHALAYFFMLPNFAFPLFPVVDYQTFRRTYFDRDEPEIYEQGLLWISRGLVHLVLYRFVNQDVLHFDDFVGLGDVVRWMLGTLLLYLRVSGQFHLAIGVLHLFGFRLPETHKLYFLARSFTDLWRRMNIYWTTFMTNVVFYPVYYRVKRIGPIAGVTLSTAAVFLVTWILHSYQWFWLQGGFPIRVGDVLFWGILGLLVVRAAVKEQKTEREATTAAHRWNWRLGLRTARTFFALCLLWSVWSAGTFDDWLYYIGMSLNVDAKGVASLAVVFLVVMTLGAYDWRPFRTSEARWARAFRQPIFRALTGLIVLLLLAQPAVRAVMPEHLAAMMASLLISKVSIADVAAAAGGGYYEKLDFRGPVNDAMAGADCVKTLFETVKRKRHDYVDFDLKPSLHLVTKCWGTPLTFSTNSQGMRDKEYAVNRPSDTLRIALLGPSFTAGWGISDGETFSQIVEKRMNREFSCPEYRHFEILNFSVPGYSVPHELALMEDRVFRFSPNVVILTVYQWSKVFAAQYVSHVAHEGIAVPYEPARALLMEAGVADSAGGGVPIPFQSLRSIAKRVGLNPAIPEGELYARAQTIVDRLDKWAIQRFGEITLTHHATPVLLALDEVDDDLTLEKTVRQTIRESGLPAIDLFDVYPEQDRHSMWASSWDPHPNAAGHRLIAERLYTELIPFVRAACSADGRATAQ